MLQRGGNAVDAALATAIALTVVEPCSNGIGSDLFAILWDGRELVGPQRIGPRARGGDAAALRRGRRRFPQRSWEAVTIPGAVSGWAALSQRFGALPFADLFAPAIRYARDGYAVSPVVADKWALAAHGAAARSGLRRALPAARPRAASPASCSAASRWPRTLEKHRRDARRRVLSRRARAGDGRAREGDTARCTRCPISPTTRSTGSTPLALDYAATTVHEIPPNGQGIAALMALGILRGIRPRVAARPIRVASQHLQIEAMKLAFADAYRYVSDPRTMDVAPSALLDPGYLASRARLIDPQARAGLRARRSAARRHGLSLRRRRARHDRVADPVELHGLRLRRRRARHGHQPAESRRRLFAGARAIPTRSAAASGRSTRSFPAS